MIQFHIRPSDETSIPLLLDCFSNTEFCYMLYGDNHVSIKKNIENNGVDIKYTCSFRYSTECPYYDIGFANCYKKKDGTYTYVGGILPKFFNSGLGVKADVAMLSYIFEKHQNIVLTTGIFKYNTRSIKLTKAVGFYPIDETDSQIIYQIEKEKFYNPFVTAMLNRIAIS